MDGNLPDSKVATNANNLGHAFDYLKQVLDARIRLHLAKESEVEELELPGLAFFEDGSAFAEFIHQHQPSFDEYIVLLLSMVSHIQPSLLDNIFRNALLNHTSSADFIGTEFGGTRDNENQLFQATGETALYILAGNDLNHRFHVQQILSNEHWFAQQNILKLAPAKSGQAICSGRLLMNTDMIERFTLGKVSRPKFSNDFPAQEIQTELLWQDLVLHPDVIERIKDIKVWVQHHHTLMDDWQMAAKFKPGYRALFYGPPGTGKTLTATLLGKYTERSVFRIDLSTVVSKYIGETEKNLAALFDKAKNKEWILFFDEADALFGKRTGIKDAHDRFANQEVSYLLQKVEEFDGLVILASNLKANMDDAFLRRFNAVISFPFPDKNEREKIWRLSFPNQVSFDREENIAELLAAYELAGGAIINVVHYACLKALSRGQQKILHYQDLLSGIQLEMEKSGKVFKVL